MSNTNTLETTPLLSDVNEDEGRCWWKNVLDLEEAKNQVLFSLPMILTNLVFYSLTLVSVMFSGHLGELQLAGATLANSWATVTGFAFMIRVARGIGWQVLAVWANLGTFYFIGMPIAGLLAFKFNLYAKGLWIGLICGLCCQAGALLVIALFRKWTKIELP